MAIGINRALPATGRDFTHGVIAKTAIAASVPVAVVAGFAHQGRGDAALYELARVQRLAQRELVDPELEPGPEFDINADTPDHDMEPLDASIESAADESEIRVIVEGDEEQITVTAEPGETLYVDEVPGAVVVEVEDE